MFIPYKRTVYCHLHHPSVCVSLTRSCQNVHVHTYAHSSTPLKFCNCSRIFFFFFQFTCSHLHTHFILGAAYMKKKLLVLLPQLKGTTFSKAPKKLWMKRLFDVHGCVWTPAKYKMNADFINSKERGCFLWVFWAKNVCPCLSEECQTTTPAEWQHIMWRVDLDPEL